MTAALFWTLFGAISPPYITTFIKWIKEVLENNLKLKDNE